MTAPAFTVPREVHESPHAQRYRCADIRRFPVGNNSDLVYFTEGRFAHIVPSDVAKILDACRTFQTVDDHLKDICNRLRVDAERARTIRRLLSDFVTMGMFVAQGDLLSQSRVSSQIRPGPIASIGFVTRNRTDQLNRALVSYVENGARYGRTNDLVVVDDSDQAAIRDQHRRLLRSLRNRYGIEVRYAGREEKLHYSKAIVDAADLPADVVNFALFDVEGCGCSIGANRNALLLDTVGDLIFSADDDTVCRIAAAPEPAGDLAFWSESDPTEFWFFSNRDAAINSVTFVDEDLLAIHERVLGKTLGSILTDLPTTAHVDLHHICPHLLQSLQSGAGRILVTFNGVIGDSGMPSPAGLLSGLQGDTRARFVRSESDYRSAMRSREVLRLAKCPSIYHGTQCMSAMLGLDNRTLLPPFLPVQRNEDGLFGLTLNLCFESSYFAHFPWALLHAPEGRSYSADYMSEVPGLTVSDLVMACILSHQFTPGRSDEKDKLQSLGRYLTELGSIALPEFEAFLRLQSWQRFSLKIAALEKLLKAYEEEPRFWADDLKKYLVTLREALPKDDFTVPCDLTGRRTAGEARELTQRLVLRFGQLLHWWPEMVDAARRLRAQGRRLTELI